MKVRFWGVRGSIPAPLLPTTLEDRLVRVLQGAVDVSLGDAEAVLAYVRSLPFDVRRTYGGHTSCVVVESGGDRVILDAGSGLSQYGLTCQARSPEQAGRTHHLFLSHLHWDHTVGLPFFLPLTDPGHEVVVYGGHPNLASSLVDQHSPPSFPVPLDELPARLSFRQMEPGAVVRVGKLRVDCTEVPHPNRSFAYRVRDDLATLIYATDAGYANLDPVASRDILSFLSDADLLIFDSRLGAGYSAQAKAHWGHSTCYVAAVFARASRSKRLALFHHDPASSDQMIHEMERRVRDYLAHELAYPACSIVAAFEGLELSL